MYLLFFLNLPCILHFSLGTNQYIVWVAQREHTWTLCAIFFACGVFVLWIYISKTQILKYSDHEYLAWWWKRICSLVPIHTYRHTYRTGIYWGRFSKVKATSLQHFLRCFSLKWCLNYMHFLASPLLPCEKYVVKVICECVRISHCVWKQKFHLSNDLHWRGQKNV